MSHHHSKEVLQSFNYNPVGRAHSTLSVSAIDCYMNLPVNRSPSPALSTVTLTPGRIRNIDQDMEALRASRQDNPFLQQAIASRESLVDSLEDNESDHTNLMSHEFPTDIDLDPFTLPEMHEHMIRSPPPTSWPKSPNFKVFQFPNGEDETLHVEVNTKLKSPKTDLKPKHMSWDGTDCATPLKVLPRPHALHHDRFSLLTTSSLRSSGEDSVKLMSSDD
ncbi:hypothetical protein RN001_004697 [Aquatica leii]|uniref:Uncharacterized protein n=1 Tax=Aquatica leii TaxID=1421715 RepID=A0AAN7PBZ9_9COLE|nr:hypothetical protein RN001_004697 [Aquatica leii]